MRHGEVYNPDNIWYGKLPHYRLSANGIKQMQKTAKYLASKNIHYIYSSPLLRTRQSAAIIQNILNLYPIHFSKDLLEVTSSLQGTSFSYIQSLQYNIFASPTNDVTGETIENVADRIDHFVKSINNMHKDKNIVAVTHGDPIMIIKTIVNRESVTNATIRYGKNEYIQHGEVYLLKFTDTNHTCIESIFKP